MAFEYATRIHLDAVNGDDVTGDGSLGNPWQFFNSSPAQGLVETGAIYQYNIIFKSDSSENITFSALAFASGIGQPLVKFTACNSVKFNGSGTFVNITGSGKGWGVWFDGFNVDGYSRFMSGATFVNGNVVQNSHVKNCILAQYRVVKWVFRDSAIENCTFDTTQASTNNQFQLHSVINTDFINCSVNNATYPYLVLNPRSSEFGSVAGFDQGARYNSFKDTDIVICTDNPVEVNYIPLFANNYQNVNGSFYDITNTVALPLIGDLVPLNSIAAMQAEYLSVFGASTTLYEQETFKAIPVDSFGLPTDETVNYKNAHQGAIRYSKNGVVTGAPIGWEFVSDGFGNYWRTTSDTPDPYIVEVEIDQARKARRVILTYSRANDIEQFGADGAFEVGIKESYDGGLTFPFPSFTRNVGIQSGTLDFDYIDSSATNWQLTLNSSGIAGGAGGVRVFRLHIEYYDVDEQITVGARTLFEQKAPVIDGYFVVGLPYKVLTSLGEFTAQEIKDNGAAIKVYADIEETNIISFELAGEIYNTFVPESVEVASVRAIKAGINGSDIEIKPIPCSDFDAKMLKFKNGAGVWEYLIFYAKDSEKPSRSSGEYLQFQDGYKTVNGDIQRDFKIYNDEFPILNKPVLDYLDKNQNVWYSNGWQFSSFTTVVNTSTAQNFPLLTNERLLLASLTQTQYNEVFKRFKTGDRITFATSSALLDMYGYISQMSESDGNYSVYFKFTGATGNDDLASLDAATGSTELFIVSFDAWELCTVDNLTVTTTNRDTLAVSVVLKSNPEVNYRI